MEITRTALQAMSRDEIVAYFSLHLCAQYQCTDTSTTYTPDDIAKMAQRLFSDGVPEDECEIILVTLAHLYGAPIPPIIKPFCDLEPGISDTMPRSRITSPVRGMT